MVGIFSPRHLGDVADERFGRALAHVCHPMSVILRCWCARSYAPGTQRWPNTGSLCGVGGSCHVPVAGGRTSASTWTSMRNGLFALTACSRAPLKSSDLVMVSASTPLALAHPAKSGL